MERINKYLKINMNHLQRNHNCLVFIFRKTKSNQTEGRSADTWHIYFNQNNSTIFPLLALVKYLLLHLEDFVDRERPWNACVGAFIYE